MELFIICGRVSVIYKTMITIAKDMVPPGSVLTYYETKNQKKEPQGPQTPPKNFEKHFCQ